MEKTSRIPNRGRSQLLSGANQTAAPMASTNAPVIAASARRVGRVLAIGQRVRTSRSIATTPTGSRTAAHSLRVGRLARIDRYLRNPRLAGPRHTRKLASEPASHFPAGGFESSAPKKAKGAPGGALQRQRTLQVAFVSRRSSCESPFACSLLSSRGPSDCSPQSETRSIACAVCSTACPELVHLQEILCINAVVRAAKLCVDHA